MQAEGALQRLPGRDERAKVFDNLASCWASHSPFIAGGREVVGDEVKRQVEVRG